MGPESRLVIPADRYEAAFDETRELLVSRGFTLDRVDARRGVISTAPIQSAGAFTPFDLRQSSFRQELDDTLNQQRRSVRVEFAPVVPEPVEPRIDPPAPARPTGDASPIDVSVGAGLGDGDVGDGDAAPGRALLARFSVIVERRTSSDLVVEPETVRMLSRPQDRKLADRRIRPIDYAPAREDRAYAGRLAAALAERLGLELEGPNEERVEQKLPPEPRRRPR